jgi:hypothetical protein
MDRQRAHEIQLERIYPTGAQEWRCHACGRRLMTIAPPGCETIALEYGDRYILVWGDAIGAVRAIKILIEAGDEQAVHYGGQVDSDPTTAESMQDEESMLMETNPWTEWLEDIDFGDL